MSESRFVLAIDTVLNETGDMMRYKFSSMNQGVSTEIILSAVRAWLKLTEEEYFETFKANYG